MVVIKAGVSFRPNTEVRFNYGDKPSQYMLLQYGFVPMNNPSECVEVVGPVADNAPEFLVAETTQCTPQKVLAL